MKLKFKLFFVICLVSELSYSQESSLYIGGMAGYSTSKTTFDSGDEYTSKEWNFSPEIGTWLLDDLQLGLNLNISGSDNDRGLTKSMFSPGVYLRKWHGLSDIFSIFGGINLSYISSNEESDNYGGDYKIEEKGFGAFIDFGAALSIGEKWSIAGRYATLGYQLTKDSDSDRKTTSFGFDVDAVGNPFNIGVYYTIR